MTRVGYLFIHGHAYKILLVPVLNSCYFVFVSADYFKEKSK